MKSLLLAGGEKWRKFVDPESGHAYYYNESTDESTYERPLDYRTIVDPFAAAREERVMPPAEVLASARSEQVRSCEERSDELNNTILGRFAPRFRNLHH